MAYDQAITPRTIKQTIRKSDFRRISEIKDPDGLNRILRAASRLARNPNPSIGSAVAQSEVRGRVVNHVVSFPFELVLRKVNANLRYATRFQPQTRDNLVSTICEVLRDTNAYCVLRLDIASFYESIDHNHLRRLVSENQLVTATSRRIINQILAWHLSGGGTGLPRGLSTSATLSDIYLSEFDQACRNNPLFFYYCRFADDILVIGDPSLEEKRTYKDIYKALPPGLTLNRSKSNYARVGQAAGVTNALQVEYLGYVVAVDDGPNNKSRRSCTIDIAGRKSRKFKSRVALSFKSFRRSGNFTLLEKRIRFLTSNYRVLDKNGKFSRLAGIHYNYPLVNAPKSSALRSLDRFLQAQILSAAPTNGPSPEANLSKHQKRTLLRNSFLKGFESRGIRNFSPAEMRAIQECWKYA